MAVTAMVTGCATGPTASEADSSNPIYQAAQSERELTWYTALDPHVADSVIEAFNTRFPDVQINLLRLTSGQLTARYSQERSAGAVPADVITSGDDVFEEDGQTRGWFETNPEVPQLATWPKEYASNGSAIVSILPLGIAYNTDSVASAPQGWQDLLSDDYANQLQFGDPRNVPAYMQLAYLMREEYGDDFLREVRAQQPTVAPSIVNANQTVAAGGARAVLPGVLQMVEDLKDKGAPIDFVQPDNTVGIEFRTMISTQAAHPNAAKLFMDFMLGADGQRALNSAAYSPLGEQFGAGSLPAGYRTVPTSEVKSSEPQILSLLGLQ
ncbi:extracellular solute-binding protein [Rhodococcus koreensis]|uniref:extracellular solute-binding protein n=1 Tax=Rhodococcus koreensis TaxID=99653 RepID=UPI00366AFA3D